MATIATIATSPSPTNRIHFIAFLLESPARWRCASAPRMRAPALQGPSARRHDRRGRGAPERDWGLGIGDWGLVGQGLVGRRDSWRYDSRAPRIPNPSSPIPR